MSGDLIDREEDHAREIENLRAVANLPDRDETECLCLMGNHDGFAFLPEEFYAVLGRSRRPKNHRKEGKTLLFLDSCYYRDGEHYHPGIESEHNGIRYVTFPALCENEGCFFIVDL